MEDDSHSRLIAVDLGIPPESERHASYLKEIGEDPKKARLANVLVRPCGYAYLCLSLAAATALAVCGAQVVSSLAELTHGSREDEHSRQRIRAEFLWYLFLVSFFTFPVTLLWSATVLLQPLFLPKLLHQKINDIKDFTTARHGHWFVMAAIIWPLLHAGTAFLCVFIISDYSRLPMFVLVLGCAIMGLFLLYGIYLCFANRCNMRAQREELARKNKEVWDRVLDARERWHIQEPNIDSA